MIFYEIVLPSKIKFDSSYYNEGNFASMILGPIAATRLTRLSACVRSIRWALAIAHAVPCRIGMIKNLLSSLVPMSRVTLVSRKLGRLFQTGATSIPEQGRQECSQATRLNYCRFVFPFPASSSASQNLATQSNLWTPLSSAGEFTLFLRLSKNDALR